MRLPLLLADDLGGALEAAAAFHAHGWRVTLPLRDDAWPPRTTEGELVVVNTETRNTTPAAAAGSAQIALALAQQRGAELCFKEIDSTLRGPIGAELRAVMELIQPTRVVLTPANPAAHRTVRDGVLLVEGVPVAETAFASDPLWPVRESDVIRVLARDGLAELGRLPLTALRAGKERVRNALHSARIVVADAENVDDLARLVQVAREVEPSTLFVGSAALARAMAAPPASTIALREHRPITGAKLLVVGSSHPTSRRQIQRLVKERGVTAIGVRPGGTGEIVRRTVGALRAQGAAALVATPDMTDPASLLSTFREAIAGIVDGVALGTLFVTGGETASAICMALGGRVLELEREWEPGTIASRLSCGKRPAMTLVTKPGGFGEDDALVRGFDAWGNG